MPEARNAPVDLYRVLLGAWSIKTSDKWRPDNPACGQCSVTALVVQDLLGGEILKTNVAGAWHFYNRIEGRRWDLTVSQFATPIGYEDVPSSRDEALADTTTQAYTILREQLGRQS